MNHAQKFAAIMQELGLEKPAPAKAGPLPPKSPNQPNPPNPDDQIDLSVQGGKFLGPRNGNGEPRPAQAKSSRLDEQGNRTIISEKARSLAGECAQNVAWETRLQAARQPGICAETRQDGMSLNLQKTGQEEP